MNSDQQYFCEYFPQGERKTITHMCFAAHFDDIEFMAYHGILQCFGRSDRWFGGVVMTDGAGSPRTGIYADYNDDQMKKIRLLEQKKAAVVGEYGVLYCLGFSSTAVKNAEESFSMQRSSGVSSLSFSSSSTTLRSFLSSLGSKSALKYMSESTSRHSAAWTSRESV